MRSASLVPSKQAKKEKHSAKGSFVKIGRTGMSCCGSHAPKGKLWPAKPKKQVVAVVPTMIQPSVLQTRGSWFLPEPTSWFVPSTHERGLADKKAYPSIPFPKHRSFKWIKSRFLYKSWSFTKTILTRRGLYRKMIFKHLRKLNLPLGLFIVAGIESNFTPRLVSATGAMGMWQFIRSTGKSVGLKRSAWVDERRDIVKSTKASIRYLRSLYRMFGKWELAIAAYNCGPGCVQAALQRCKKRSLWTIRHWRGCGISKEASEYVARFYGLLYYWKHPPASKKMIGTFPTVPSLKFEIVQTKGTVSLLTLAKASGVSVKDLYELNPELGWWLTPPGENYSLKVPPNTASKVRDFIQNEKKAISWKIVPVGRGQSLRQIGRKYRVSAYTLKYVNRVWGSWALRTRKVLIVPLPRGKKSWPKRKSKRKALRVLTRFGRRYSWRFPSHYRYWYRYRHSCYRVRSGDTLRIIAKRVYVSLKRLKKYNAGIGPIKPGIKLRLRSHSKCHRRRRKKKRQRETRRPNLAD